MLFSKINIFTFIFIACLPIIPIFAQSSDIISKSDDSFNLPALASKYRIVLLGETNHGVSQQYSAMADLSMELFKNNFELLQSESSFYRTYVELLKNGNPSIQGLSMIYKDAEEFSSFVDFAKRKELLHAGFDPQVIVPAEDINFIINQFELNPAPMDIFKAGIEDLADNIIANKAFLHLCTELMEKDRNDVLKIQLLKNLLWANEILVKTSHLSGDEFKAYHSNYRDHAMAMNFLFWDTYFGHKKTIVIGASGHLSYGFTQIDNEELRSFIPMGKIIKESMLKSDVINIALSIKNGESKALNDNSAFVFPYAANTLENGHPQYPALLCTDSLTHNASLVLGEEVNYGNWSGSFDYILVFENVTPISHALKKVVYSEYPGEDRQNTTLFILKDDSSGLPVDFAHVYFSKKGEGTTSNEKGRFVIKNSEHYIGDEMEISKIGYKTRSISFPSVKKDTVIIHLTSEVNVLEEVVINGKVLTPLSKVQKVRKNLASMDYLHQLNYYHVISKVNDSIDTLRNESIIQFEFESGKGFDPDKGIGRVDILTRKKLKRSLYSKFTRYLSFPFIGVTWTHPSVLRFFNYDEQKMTKYFSLYEEQDALNSFTKIHFKALNTSKRITGMPEVTVYEGVLWIDEDSYLPVKINLFIQTSQAGKLHFSTDFEKKDNALIAVFSQHTHEFMPDLESNRQVVLEETSTWLKQKFVEKGDLIPHTDHDMTLIAPDQKIWDEFNEFIQ